MAHARTDSTNRQKDWLELQVSGLMQRCWLGNIQPWLTTRHAYETRIGMLSASVASVKSMLKDFLLLKPADCDEESETVHSQNPNSVFFVIALTARCLLVLGWRLLEVPPRAAHFDRY
jgi:hypothetical protein